MDNKTTIIIAVVAVVIIAAVAAFVVMNNGNGGGSEPTDDDKEYYIDTKLRVFGNANNDDYLDNKDLAFIKDIADGKTSWHSTANPLADANVDGKVDSKDYNLVKDFLDGKEGTMYYVDWDNKKSAVDYPLTRVLNDGGIHTVFSTGLDWLIIYGIYDKVTWMSNGDIGPSDLVTDLYPNIDKVKEVKGRLTNDTYESMIKDKIKITMGDKKFYEDSFLNAVEKNFDNYNLNVIKLPMNRAHGDVTWFDTFITLGAMLNLQDKSKAYINYVEKVENKVIEAVKKADVGSKTYIMPYFAPGYDLSPLYVDAHGVGNVILADVYTVEMLPLYNGVSVYTSDGFDAVDIETIKKYNPNVLIISNFGYATSKTTSEEKLISDLNDIGDEFRAVGYTGQIVSIAFENCTMAGPSFILCLANLLWPDAFDEDEAWQMMYEYYHDFTNYKGSLEDLKASKFAVWEYLG